MHIDEIHISGFGHFDEFSFTNIPHGLSVIHGTNEAGKTTLLQFLRTVLFGFPRQKKWEFYPPHKGGRHGGRLILNGSAQDRAIVERYSGKGHGPVRVTFADGSDGGEDAFRQLLGAATRDVYENVFAFSLGELQSFDSLQNDAVRDAIYSAGTGTGRITIPQVLQDLDTEISDLFAPRGRNPKINVLLGELDDARKSLNEHQTDLDEYSRLCSEISALQSQLHETEQKLQEGRRRLDRVKLLQQAWPEWVALKDARERLREIPVIETFPEDGIRRLEEHLSELKFFDRQSAELEDDLAALIGQRQNIAVDEDLLQSAAMVRLVERGLQGFEDAISQLPQVKAEMLSLERQFKAVHQEIGAEWDDEFLRAFDLSVAFREEIRSHEEKLHTTREAYKEASLRLENEKSLLKKADENVIAAEQNLEELESQDAPDEAAIRRVIEKRSVYQSARDDLPSVKAELKLLAEPLDRSLQNLGWDENQVIHHDERSGLKEDLRKYQSDIQEFDARCAYAQEIKRKAKLKWEETAEECKGTQENDVPNTAASRQEIEDRKRGLRALRKKIYRRDATWSWRSATGPVAGENNPPAKAASAGIPSWPAMVFLLAGLIALAVGALNGELRTGIILFAGACVASGIAAFMHLKTGRGLDAPRQESDTVRQHQREPESLALKELDLQIHEMAGALDIPVEHCTHEGLDEQEAQIDAEAGKLQSRIERRRSLEKAELEHEQAAAELGTATGDRDKVVRAFQQLLTESDLPPELSPSEALDVLADLSSAREKLVAAQSLGRRIQQMESCVRDFEEEASRLCGSASNTVEELDRQLDRSIQHRKRCDEARSICNAARQHLLDRKLETKEAKRLLLSKREGDEAARRAWIDFLLINGLRENISPSGAFEMLNRIASARELMDQLRAVNEKDQFLSDSIQAYRKQASDLAAKVGLSARIQETSVQVATLATNLRESQDCRQRASELDSRLEELTRKQKLLLVQRERVDEKLCELLGTADTDSEDAFRKRWSDYSERRSLLQKISQHETRLQQLAGIGPALDALCEELCDCVPQELVDEKLEFEATIPTLEASARELVDECGRLSETRNRMQDSDAQTRLRLHIESLKAKLNEHVHEWSVLSLAKALIEKSRDNYERERRPAVLKSAETFFRRLTQNRYTELRAPAGESRILAITPDGTRKDFAHLSRGTAEQLYLSLRFGFINEFTRRSKPLPLVFDDILVNFDEARAKSTLESMYELAESHQILLFTCHESTVGLAREVKEDVDVFRLDGGKLKAESQ
ncbi:MAG: AAA family ATPase [Planctomycetota bacterium]|nr:AAA family ATPase [Planctomycetota bacterium]MDP7251819.1 AAA family ATPase [Planctomycetota bacterium]